MLFYLVLIFSLLPMSLCAMEESLSLNILSPGSKLPSPGKLVYTNPDFDATTESYFTLLTPSKKSKSSPLSPAKRLELLSGPERERSSKAVELKRNLFELSNKLKGNQSSDCQPHAISLDGFRDESIKYYTYSLQAESLLRELEKAVEDLDLNKTLHYSRELNNLVKVLENEQGAMKGSNNLQNYILRERDKRLADEPDNEEFALNKMSSVIELEMPMQKIKPIARPVVDTLTEEKDHAYIMSCIGKHKDLIDYYLTARPLLKDFNRSVKAIEICRAIESDFKLINLLKVMRSEEKSLDPDSLHAMHILQEHIEKKMESSIYTKPHPDALLLKMKELERERRNKRAREED